MKQQITVEQMMELSQSAKKKYRKLFPAPSEITYADIHGCQTIRRFRTKEHVALVSIGQMIEFLEEKSHFVIIGKKQDYDVYTFPMVVLKNKELCDALWEAVKEVLE